MENLTPLQQRANQLREEFTRLEADTQKQRQDKIELESRDLINKFSASFSTLYSLLIGSNVQVQADSDSANPVILLSYKNNKAALKFEKSSGNVNSWTLFDQSFNATQPSRQLGTVADRRDEDKLIIALEEILFK